MCFRSSAGRRSPVNRWIKKESHLFNDHWLHMDGSVHEVQGEASTLEFRFSLVLQHPIFIFNNETNLQSRRARLGKRGILILVLFFSLNTSNSWVQSDHGKGGDRRPDQAKRREAWPHGTGIPFPCSINSARSTGAEKKSVAAWGRGAGLQEGFF